MPEDDQYRQAVQGRVEEMLSKRHDKSTSRLIVEAVVEGARLYQSYKEVEGKEERKRRRSGEKRRHRRHGEGGLVDENEKGGDRRRHDHTHRERTDRPKDGRRHQHRSRSRGRDHRRHRDSSHGKYRSSSQYKYNNPSLRVHDDRSGSSEGHGDYDARVPMKRHYLKSGVSGYQTSWEDPTSQSRPYFVPDQERDVSNSREVAPASDQLKIKAPRTRSKERSCSPEYKSNTRLETKRVPTPHSVHQRGKEEDSSSRHQSRVHQRDPDTQVKRAVACHSPVQQQRGLDGIPFGSLPKYKFKAGIALGLGDHFVNMYKHIKAEHDAGYRTKGFVEKTLDGVRKKRPDVKTSKDKQGRDGEGPEQYRREEEHEDNANEEDRPMYLQPHASGSLEKQDTINPPIEPHYPVEPEITSKTASPITSHVPSGQSQGVEEQERAQAAQAQAEDEKDTGLDPSRALRKDSLNVLEGGNTGAGTTNTVHAT